MEPPSLEVGVEGRVRAGGAIGKGIHSGIFFSPTIFYLQIAGLFQGLHFIVNIEFSVNILKVLFHCAGTHGQHSGNLALLQPSGTKAQYISFTGGQRTVIHNAIGEYNKGHKQ